MKCYLAIETQNGNVPCGQCINCRINKGRIWTGRILCEWMASEFMPHFQTFTYDDEHVPRTEADSEVLTLSKIGARKFVKEAKRLHGPFRYYCVGEYGDRTHRPHLHMAIFPRSDSQATEVANSWKYGFIRDDEMSEARAAYLARYTTKKLTSPTDDRLRPGQEPEFRIGSLRPGLGAAALPYFIAMYEKHPAHMEHIERCGDVQRHFRWHNKNYPFGNYMLTKLREHFDIPVLHTARMDHPGYYRYFTNPEPERDFIKADATEVLWHAKENQKRVNRCAI